MSELIGAPWGYDEEALNDKEQITFVVDDDKKAEWCLDKIREAEAEKAKWKEFYADRLEKINAQEDQRIEYMKYLLQQYFRTVPHKVTKTQESYQLPSGKLVYKQQAPEYERDDNQLLPWLHQNNMKGFIRVQESVDWAGLKKILTDLQVVGNSGQLITNDGEVIPGITVTERPDVFKVEVK